MLGKFKMSRNLQDTKGMQGELFISSYFVLAIATLLIVAIFLFVPSTVFAAGSAHGSGHSVVPPPFGEFVSGLGKFWINFGLYCFLVYLVARKPLVKGYAARRSAIEDRVLSGARALEAAQAEFAVVEKKLAGVDGEIVRIQKEIRTETESEVAAIGEDARQRALRIAQQAADSISAERRSVEQQVEQELIAAALLLAREKLEKGSTRENDASVRSAALKFMPQLVQ
jgi:F0F1-type ATP synthase membrane subunit b/b'